jgi:hypothetical protein
MRLWLEKWDTSQSDVPVHGQDFDSAVLYVRTLLSEVDRLTAHFAEANGRRHTCGAQDERARIRAAIEGLPVPLTPPGYIVPALDGLVSREAVLAAVEGER